jgi:hypothetical protein
MKESEGVEIFQILPYKSFITQDTPWPLVIQILKCLFKYHFFLQLEESHFSCILNLFNNSGVKLGLSSATQI